MNTQCFWAPHFSFCCPSLVLHFPMAMFSLLSIAWTQQKGRRPVQPAAACGFFLLCSLCLHVSTPKISAYPNRGQGSGCLLHHPHTNAQSYYIQCEKQGGDGGPEKSNSENFPCEDVDNIFSWIPGVGYKSIYNCIVIKILFLLSENSKTNLKDPCIDPVDHKKLWKNLEEMGIPGHLTCLLRNVCRSRGNRTGHGKQIGFKSGKEYVKDVYCHPAYLTSMQSTSWERLGWMEHKVKSGLPGEISLISDMQITPPLWKKAKKN